MTIDTYGLPEDQYLDLFKENALFTLKTFSAMINVAIKNNVKLNNFTDKFVWDLFQDIAFSTENAARQLQKEKDPEEFKRKQYDTTLVPSREELLDEIKSVTAKVEALTEYISAFIQGHNQ